MIYFYIRFYCYFFFLLSNVRCNAKKQCRLQLYRFLYAASDSYSVKGNISEGVDRGVGLPLPPLVSLLPSRSGAREARKIFLSLPPPSLFIPIFLLLPPPLLPPPTPSSPTSLLPCPPLISYSLSAIVPTYLIW